MLLELPICIISAVLVEVITAGAGVFGENTWETEAEDRRRKAEGKKDSVWRIAYRDCRDRLCLTRNDGGCWLVWSSYLGHELFVVWSSWIVVVRRPQYAIR